ncbi:MAG: MBL fold metallo-hydrolase [Sedimentisphaerales bacterium]|nr:MBL fold metallo-hydrolase [Sedimentisphaerales bacterium]
MKRILLLLTIFLSLAGCAASNDRSAASGKTLDIYFMDMAGGASTLIVTPLGESVLIDTGSLEPKHRDADRIERACKHAGLEQIDCLVTTHFDIDHYGGIYELSRRIPIKRFIDSDTPPARYDKRQAGETLSPLYEQATKGKTSLLEASEDIPLKNSGKGPKIRLHCVASQKKIEGFSGDIDAPVEGFEIRKPDTSNNAYSITLVLTYGDFKFFAGGDITWNVEHHLAHPVNRIGKVDLYQVTHHGLDLSNNTILLKALAPTVAVAMNGPRKGIQPRTFKDLNALPSLKALYTIHYNTQYGDQGNPPAEFIANREDPSRGEYIKASVNPDKKTFTIQTGPEGKKKTYPIRP